jgi:hypothetical protein
MGTRLAMVIALATSACMVGDPTMPTDEDLPPLQSEAAFSNNPRTAFNFFVSKGLTDVQAAGVVGNLMQESSVSPTAVEYGGGPGRGIAQWSIGGRFNSGSKSLTAYATARGQSKWALNTQLDFIWYELATVGGYGLPELRQTTTLSQAVTVFQNKYEICGACAQGKRLTYAQQILSQYGGTASSGTGTGTGTGTTTSETCYSGTLDREMPENACVESMYDGLWYQCSNGEWVDRWSDPNPCSGEYPL